MDQKKRSVVKVKKKMTKEQMQMAIIKKRECDAKALAIVEQLLEPQIDPAWLIENLKDLNRCHMEDVIEERAIIKLCGYVLCQKPLTIKINQQYHISLKNKKVYDVTKRKNFCSSSCFGASNYLLEQMLTSPLWMRDKEEIPKFQIFSKDVLKSNHSHGEEVDIALVESCSKNEGKEKNKIKAPDKKSTDDSQEGHHCEKNFAEISNETGVTGCIENFVRETFEQININKQNTEENSNVTTKLDTPDNEESRKKSQLIREKLVGENKSTLHEVDGSESKDIQKEFGLNQLLTTSSKSIVVENDKSTIEINKDLGRTKITEQSQSHELSSKVGIPQYTQELEFKGKNLQACTQKDYNTSNQSITVNVKDERSTIGNNKDFGRNILEGKIVDELSSKNHSVTPSSEFVEKISGEISTVLDNRNLQPHSKKDSISKNRHSDKLGLQDREAHHEKDAKDQTKVRTKKLKTIKTEKGKKASDNHDENLAYKVEQSFQEWVSEETIEFLFGDDSIKKKAIEKIEHRDKYSILCEKLNRLQFQDEQEDAQVLEKPVLKPAPHFEVLKEEGQKLDLKVRAFYQGKTTFGPVENAASEQKDADADTFLPLTDAHAPQTLRRKIFLDRLDQVLPDLLRTLAGNNEVYARASCNYTSVRCTAVKALVHTFSLSAKNIIFKSAEWTLVGLVIIKMLSLIDPWLATLLMTRQANLYTSMILTSYRLNPDYLSLFVASFNPEMNPR